MPRPFTPRRILVWKDLCGPQVYGESCRLGSSEVACCGETLVGDVGSTSDSQMCGLSPQNRGVRSRLRLGVPPPHAELTVLSIAGSSEILVLNRGSFCFPGGTWQCLTTLLAVTAWSGVLLASMREGPGMPLHILQGMGQLSTHAEESPSPKCQQCHC